MQEDFSGEVKSKVRTKDGFNLDTQRRERRKFQKRKEHAQKNHRQDREHNLSY